MYVPGAVNVDGKSALSTQNQATSFSVLCVLIGGETRISVHKRRQNFYGLNEDNTMSFSVV